MADCRDSPGRLPAGRSRLSCEGRVARLHLMPSSCHEGSVHGQPETPSLVSVADYLASERAAEERHEYLDGQIRAMAGESPNTVTV